MGTTVLGRRWLESVTLVEVIAGFPLMEKCAMEGHL